MESTEYGNPYHERSGLSLSIWENNQKQNIRLSSAIEFMIYKNNSFCNKKTNIIPKNQYQKIVVVLMFTNVAYFSLFWTLGF